MTSLPAPTLVYESDWLASSPFFYDLRTGAASHDINAVIDLADLEFDPEGLRDYLDFGFSVFERTPVKGVHMLRHSARLWRDPAGSLRVEHLEDPAYAWLERRTTVPEVLALAEARINEAAGAEGEVVVPTSGGYDSRLIDLLLRDRSRLRAFTYGTSDDPTRSTEVVKARELARRLGVRWELIELGDFHRYFDEWDALYGVSTHAHGMYHLEFYRKLLERVPQGSRVITGACGEWFAGDDPEVRVVPKLRTREDVLRVFRYGGMRADSAFCRLPGRGEGAERLLEEEPRIRAEMLPRVFTVVRMRLTLLSYLNAVPRHLGLDPRAPYLDIDLAMSMLTLPEKERHGRLWLHRVFAEAGVDLESRPLPTDDRNTLNFRAMREGPLRPLDARLLAEIVDPEYVRAVNRDVGRLGVGWEALWRLGHEPGFRRAVSALRGMGVKEQRLSAYGAYLTLRPLEALLRRRDRARDGDVSPVHVSGDARFAPPALSAPPPARPAPRGKKPVATAPPAGAAGPAAPVLPAPTLVYESDWLASSPFFYNLRTGAASHDINAVIDLADLEFDPEGLRDYLDFGFSVFERTPVKGVHMLRHSARLWRDPAGSLRVEHLEDPAYAWLERRTTVPEVLALAEARINEAAGAEGEVVVPTSGGYDSRLIDLLLRDRSRLRAFTYGTSDDPTRSTEVVKARELARRLGVRWELIELGDFHRYFDEWDALYGVSTHAHGMYHLEFYRKLLERVPQGSRVITGACGEWFAGDDPEVRVVPKLRTREDVLRVFRYGGMRADSAFCRLPGRGEGAERLLEEEPLLSTDGRLRVVRMVRMRMAWLSYLLEVPRHLGFSVRAPYLDAELALSMLALPEEQRVDRTWQRNIFRDYGVDLEAHAPSSDGRNTVNYRAMRRHPLRPLDALLLAEIIDPEYVRAINRDVGRLGVGWEALWRMGHVPGLRRAVAGVRSLTGPREPRVRAYDAYLTLRPLEDLMRRRKRVLAAGGG